jgi:hypothetical protein
MRIIAPLSEQSLADARAAQRKCIRLKLPESHCWVPDLPAGEVG